MAKPLDTPNERAARGQAYNLAVLTSIADGKHDDPQYVIKQYFKHKEMASILQNCDESVVVEYVDNPKVVEALETLRTLFNSKVEGT